MFSTLVEYGIDVLEWMQPLWELLTTRISMLPRVALAGDWFNNLGSLLINSLLDAIETIAINLIGDVTLLQFVLGGAFAAVITIYIIKFILSAIPLA